MCIGYGRDANVPAYNGLRLLQEIGFVGRLAVAYPPIARSLRDKRCPCQFGTPLGVVLLRRLGAGPS
jgi:hypothetical protein